MLREQTHEIATMVVSPVHHWGDGETAGERGRFIRGCG
ncbi:Unknown protein sequence [Pseudomonas syringae pv. maculicola]|nr:Unknown protein sequence [Pseudomonas syringae pv. maculicola]